MSSSNVGDSGLIYWKRGEDVQLSEHFKAKEFECPCGKCTDQQISRSLISKLEHVRHDFNEPISVNSGYRCPEHNAAVGGHSSSTHLQGLAADIRPKFLTTDSLDQLYDLCYSEFDNIGNGRNRGFIHVDDRPAKPTGKRLWLYV